MDKPLKVNSTVGSLLIAALAAGSVAIAVEHWRNARQSAAARVAPLAAEQSTATAAPASANTVVRGAATKAGGWSASAPGRVEPRDGEVRIGAQLPGKVAQVLVRMNDTVKAGDLLVRLVDDEPLARLTAATAEAAVRRRERDSEQATKVAGERRTADDTVAFAERSAFRARMDLDRLQASTPVGTRLVSDIETARKALVDANDKLEQERVNLRRFQAQPALPLPTRLEASLATARAELLLIESALERTRLRAPSDGSVLLVNTRAGETVSPSPEDVLLVFGDLSQLRIRAELEERDVAKIRVGQAVVVRTDAFPGQDFAGRVQSMASAFGAARIASRGPRRPNDQEVLQVLIDLDGQPALVPGMRADVFFKPDAIGATPVPGIQQN